MNICTKTIIKHNKNNYIRLISTSSSSGQLKLEGNYDVDKLYDTNYLNVPKLPLPTLEKTLNRYIETVEPIAENNEEFELTKKYVNDYLNSDIGKELHNGIKEVANLPDTQYPYSYIERYWDEMYYGGRWPLPVNVNPFFVFHDEPTQDPTKRASLFSVSLLRWWVKVVEGRLEGDFERDGSPLCPSQYGQIFGVERKPGVDTDDFIRHPHSKHVIVRSKNRFYKINCISDDNVVISPDELDQILKSLFYDNSIDTLSNDNDVGLLTSSDRTHYALSRIELEKDNNNKDILKDIDTSLFIINLDDIEYGTTLKNKSKQIIHGDNCINRWWDKHQVIVSKDGCLGMNFEHGCNDGLSWARMIHESWNDMINKESGFSKLVTDDKLNKPGPNNDTNINNLELKFNLTETDINNIKKSFTDAKALCDDVDISTLEFDDYGANFIKKQMKMSPDGLAQMSFQLAYRRLHNKNPPTYEACAMKSYLHGRTETIRSCTMEASNFVDAFMNNDTDDNKRNLLSNAAKRHGEVAKGAKLCGLNDNPNLGVDRHLYAMKMLATEKGIVDDIDLFNDPLFTKSSTWLLSTSNVTSPIWKAFGFGAVSANGYGLGYMTSPENIPLIISSYKSGQTENTSSEKMGDEIKQALLDFKKLYE